jgi:hypothetical protein
VELTPHLGLCFSLGRSATPKSHSNVLPTYPQNMNVTTRTPSDLQHRGPLRCRWLCLNVVGVRTAAGKAQTFSPADDQVADSTAIGCTSRRSFESRLPYWPNMTLRPAAFCFASFSPRLVPRQPVS